MGPDGSRFELPDKSCRCGSSPGADYVIPAHFQVAPLHCTFWNNGSGHIVEDNLSSLPTRINGEVVSMRRLEHGDSLQIGEFVCHYEASAVPQATGPMPLNSSQSHTGRVVQSAIAGTCAPKSQANMRHLFFGKKGGEDTLGNTARITETAAAATPVAVTTAVAVSVASEAKKESSASACKPKPSGDASAFLQRLAPTDSTQVTKRQSFFGKASTKTEQKQSRSSTPTKQPGQAQVILQPRDEHQQMGDLESPLGTGALMSNPLFPSAPSPTPAPQVVDSPFATAASQTRGFAQSPAPRVVDSPFTTAASQTRGPAQSAAPVGWNPTPLSQTPGWLASPVLESQHKEPAKEANPTVATPNPSALFPGLAPREEESRAVKPKKARAAAKKSTKPKWWNKLLSGKAKTKTALAKKPANTNRAAQSKRPNKLSLLREKLRQKLAKSPAVPAESSTWAVQPRSKESRAAQPKKTPTKRSVSSWLGKLRGWVPARKSKPAGAKLAGPSEATPSVDSLASKNQPVAAIKPEPRPKVGTKKNPPVVKPVSEAPLVTPTSTAIPFSPKVESKSPTTPPLAQPSWQNLPAAEIIAAPIVAPKEAPPQEFVWPQRQEPSTATPEPESLVDFVWPEEPSAPEETEFVWPTEPESVPKPVSDSPLPPSGPTSATPERTAPTKRSAKKTARAPLGKKLASTLDAAKSGLSSRLTRLRSSGKAKRSQPKQTPSEVDQPSKPEPAKRKSWLAQRREARHAAAMQQRARVRQRRSLSRPFSEGAGMESPAPAQRAIRQKPDEAFESLRTEKPLAAPAQSWFRAWRAAGLILALLGGLVGYAILTKHPLLTAMRNKLKTPQWQSPPPPSAFDKGANYLGAIIQKKPVGLIHVDVAALLTLYKARGDLDDIPHLAPFESFLKEKLALPLRDIESVTLAVFSPKNFAIMWKSREIVDTQWINTTATGSQPMRQQKFGPFPGLVATLGDSRVGWICPDGITVIVADTESMGKIVETANGPDAWTDHAKPSFDLADSFAFQIDIPEADEKSGLLRLVSGLLPMGVQQASGRMMLAQNLDFSLSELKDEKGQPKDTAAWLRTLPVALGLKGPNLSEVFETLASNLEQGRDAQLSGSIERKRFTDWMLGAQAHVSGLLPTNSLPPVVPRISQEEIEQAMKNAHSNAKFLANNFIMAKGFGVSFGQVKTVDQAIEALRKGVRGNTRDGVREFSAAHLSDIAIENAKLHLVFKNGTLNFQPNAKQSR